MKGSAFLSEMKDVVDPARDELALKMMLTGNVPPFLNELQTCTTDAVIDGKYYRCTYRTPPQYLAIGEDDDFVLWPLTEPSLQAYCSARLLTGSDGSQTQQFFIPTRKIVKNTWRQSACKIIPQPISRVSESNKTGHPGTKTETIAAEQRMINEALLAVGCGLRAFSRPKKAYIVRPNLSGLTMAFGGWFYPGGARAPNGKPFILAADAPYRTQIALSGGTSGDQIQPWDSNFHEFTYEDYSHGCDLVYYACDVNGEQFGFDELCSHPILHPLVSDEGPFNPRFPNAGKNALALLNQTNRLPAAQSVVPANAASAPIVHYAVDRVSGIAEVLNPEDDYPIAAAPLGIDALASADPAPNADSIRNMWLFGLAVSALGALVIHRAKKMEGR
jgi:hypothetical protein